MPLLLTDEQDAIIYAPIGHYVISAVAGSGKTTTLAYRIKHLLNLGVPAKRIVVLMFNRSAKNDFQKKLETLLKEDPLNSYPIPEVRTFHSMAYRLYLRFIQEGYLPAFNQQILTDKEQDFQLWRLLNQLLSGEQLQDLKRHKKDHIEASREFIELVKSSLDSPERVYEAKSYESKFNYLLDLFDLYESWRKSEARISYSDMLYDTVKAIQKHAYLKQLIENKMDIILVDEYQDTNDIQHALLKYIAGDRAKITVVGDPDQTIYEFRGAKPEYMLSGFSNDFSDASQLSLSFTFRYGHAVSLLANHLISKNRSRLPVLCKSHSSTAHTQIHLHRSPDEAAALCTLLKEFDSFNLRQCTILIRLWSQSVSIELALLESQIPYHIDGFNSVFHSSEIKAIQAILELSSGIFGSINIQERQMRFESITQFPHIGLTEYVLKQLCQNLAAHSRDYGSALRNLISSEISAFQKKKLDRLARVFDQIENSSRPCRQILSLYAEETELYEGIRALSFNHEQAEERVNSIKSIISFVSKQSKCASEVLSQLDELAYKASNQDPHSLKITSIHRAKGLEWKHVLIPGLNKNTFPHSLNPNKITLSEIESERRLLYVAMTRAIEHLYLFAPSSAESKASRFEHELNFVASEHFSTHLYNNIQQTYIAQNKVSSIIKLYADALGQLIETQAVQDETTFEKRDEINAHQIIWHGKRVEHCLLGVGVVIEEKTSSFTVEFESSDQRTFSKEFAGRFFSLLEDAPA